MFERGSEMTNYLTIEESIIKNRIIIKRRKEQLHRQVAVLAISFFIFSLIFSLFTFNSLAKNNNEREVYKYYTSIEISCGDTLNAIADTYNDIEQCSNEKYIDEVMTINNLQSDKISAGNYLIVPYYSYEVK